MSARSMQRLLVAIALAVFAHLGTVVGQTSVCRAPPQTSNVLRKFSVPLWIAIYNDYFILGGGDGHIGGVWPQ